MSEPYEPGTQPSSYSKDEDLSDEDSYNDLISLTQPYMHPLATTAASPRSARPLDRSALVDPFMTRTDVADQPASVTSDAHCPDLQSALVPPSISLAGSVLTTTALSTLRALLIEALSHLRSFSIPQSGGQEIPAAIGALSMAPQTSHDPDLGHNLFDPSNLVEQKFFTGSSEEISSYLRKYFINGLDPEQRLEMVKRYKRTDIPSITLVLPPNRAVSSLNRMKSCNTKKIFNSNMHCRRILSIYWDLGLHRFDHYFQSYERSKHRLLKIAGCKHNPKIRYCLAGPRNRIYFQAYRDSIIQCINCIWNPCNYFKNRIRASIPV